MMDRGILRIWMLSMSFLLITSCASIDWRNDGFSDSDEAQWEAAGFSPDEPGIAASWRDQAISPGASMMWRKASFTPPEAKSWESNFFTIQEAEAWIKVAGFDKFSGNDAASWRKAGFTPETATPYRLKGISLADAVASREQNADALKRDREWKSCGFSRDEKLRWEYAGYSSPSACPWKKEKFSLDSARKWKAVNIDAGDAFMWRLSGFSPSAASEWKAAGFAPSDAALEKRNGLTPLLASLTEAAGRSLSSARLIAKSSKRECGQVPGTAYPYMESPYSLVGHCFIMENAFVYQLLGRSRGIMSAGYGGGEFFYINAGREIADSNLFPAIVKVIGVYKYETVMGSVNIIPSVKKIASIRR